MRGPIAIAWCLAGVLAGLGGCAASTSAESVEDQAGELRSAPLSPRSSRPAPDRLVAIGDLHGDLIAARQALTVAGAIDAQDKWVGGKLVVVQTGDQIDRGDDDRAVMDLFEKLRGEARGAGGEVIAMAGNHELMNAAFDFRYVTPASFASFADTPVVPGTGAARYGRDKQGRAAAFLPGGPYAKMIADRPVIMRVGDSIFVHGGVHAKHVTYGVDRINDGVRAWLLDETDAPPPIAVADDGPVWTRAYSETESLGPSACAKLGEVLSSLRAKRMVMGHTVQDTGVTSACDGAAWRVDVGMSHHYGGPVQVLEIKGAAVKVLTDG